MAIDARRVDPRDQVWEVDHPAYRVVFWQGATADEWDLTGCDVDDAVRWARASADGRPFVLHAVVPAPDGVGLVRLLGTDPTPA